jgi:hypothetical protein
MNQLQTREERLEHLKLELEAFDDPKYCAQVARFGDTGFEDFVGVLEKNPDYLGINEEV